MLSNKSASGTSFHDKVWTATYNDMVKAIGEPQYTGIDKSNYMWVCELPKEDVLQGSEVFTVYDWKYYRPLRNGEVVEWHIGSHDAYTSMLAIDYLMDAFSSLLKK